MKVSVKAQNILDDDDVDATDNKRKASSARNPDAVSPRLVKQTTRSQEPQKSPATRVVVSARAFRRWWIFVVAVHCFCGVFLGFVGAFYYYLVGTSVITDLSNYSTTSSAAHFPGIAKTYFALSSLHGAFVAFVVFRSIQAHKLVFRKPRSRAPPTMTRVESIKKQSETRKGSVDFSSSPSASQATESPLTGRFPAWAHRIWSKLHTVFAAFDVQNENYGVVFLSRELVLTFLQTYQAYRMSCLVPRLWMNNMMVGLLVLNCWATPLLAYCFRANVGHIRLGGALVNMMLDMVSYIGLPTALLVPYAVQLNKDVKQFDRIYWYTDIWLVELINEAQIILVTSPYDAISKYLIALSATRGLYSITKLISKADLMGSTRDIVACSRESSDVAPVAPFDDQVLNPVPVSHSRLPGRSRLERIGHQLLFLWGLFVLIAHLQASSLRTYPQCRLPIRPWFGRQSSCALLEINCVEEQATGTASEINEILRIFDPSRVEYLVIRHCPLLVMPQRIQTLHVLLGLKVFNSTILEWSDETAITNTHHPQLRFLFLVDVRMRELPVGLQSPNFPKALHDIELSRTNLTVIPDTLDRVWPKGIFIAFEECQLQEFPPVVLRMQPQDLGLSLNNITVIPSHLLEGYQGRLLLLDGNPITSFPSALRQPPQIVLLDLIGTQISDFPDWMDEAFLATMWVVAGNTPLCDRLIAAGEASASEPRAVRGIFGLDCTHAFISGTALNWYPIDLESVINPSYTLT